MNISLRLNESSIGEHFKALRHRTHAFGKWDCKWNSGPFFTFFAAILPATYRHLRLIRVYFGRWIPHEDAHPHVPRL